MSITMKALVTGGAGFIGSHLALRLEREGHQVTVLDDFSSARKKNLEGFKGRLIHQDLSKPFDLDEKFEVIFHQAAITDPRHPHDDQVYEKNVKGFENIIRWCLDQEAKLIFASTAGLYGNGSTPMKEDQAKECLTAYGRSKLKMEELASKHLKNLHWVGLRYFNVFGPHEAHKGRPASMIYHLWNQMRLGKRPRIFKWGEQVRDFVYVKDAVEANFLALTGVPGIYNVGTGIGTSFNLLVTCLNDALRTKLEPEYFDMPYESSTYQHNTVADVTQAKKGLSFKTSWSLPDAIEDYINFLQKTEGETHE